MTDLATTSLIATYSAMGVYTFAFVLFTVDLASRAVADGQSKPTRWLRSAMALTWLGWVIHLAADVMRGIAASRVPWANMFEFGLTATLALVGVFLGISLFRDVRFVGSFITGFAILALGIVSTNFYVAVTPLPPALQDYWLVIHVFVAVLGTGFFATSAALSSAQLFQSSRESGNLTGRNWRFLSAFPSAEALESLVYRLTTIGFVFWTFTVIAGAIWAEHAWGRYWGWDTKEVWSFVIWVLFAGYIHARATRGWRGNPAAVLNLIGFTAVIFNFTIVNLFFKGLHVYSGL
ncbi:MAG: c-type cytochrome biogenesis protein CcsB [Microbacteriaceae bacterium]